MPGQRHTPGSRSRGSWLPRLAGLGAIVLLAGGGAAAYVITFHPAAHHHAPRLPTKVASVETIGLIAQSAVSGQPSGSGGQLVQMLGPQGAPTFTPLAAAAANAQGSPKWTADLMVGNTYIFIFLPGQDCLAAGSHSALVLARCDLGARQQRWRRVSPEQVKDGHDFYQYANLADGKCLSQITAQPGQQVGAGLATCSPTQPASQMIAFWWLTV